MTALTYGPHQDQDAPDTVPVRLTRGAPEIRVPVHPGLIEQRRHINDLAAGTLRRIADRKPA